MTNSSYPVDETTSRDRFGIWTLAIANGISQFGNSVTSLAIPWFVLVTTGSASRTGLASAVVAFSPVAAGLLSGPVVDRLGFRRTSIISDALSGVTVAIIPVLYLIDWLTFWQLLVLIFLGAFFDVPGQTARSALVPALARRARMPLERANSVLQMSFSLSDAALAPLVAGVLISAIGAANVLFVDAGTFGVSILIVWLLIAAPVVSPASSSETADAESDSNSKIDELLAGFRFVVRDSVLRTILPAAVLVNFIGRAFGGVLLPVYVLNEYDEPAYLGLLISALGVGILCGIFAYGAWGDRVGRYNTFLGSFALTGAAIWLFTVPTYLPTDLLGLFILGIGFGPLNPLLQTLVQIRTPERMLGRVLSAMFTLFPVAAPLGALVAGFAIDILGLRTTMILMAAMLSTVPFWLGLAPWPRAAAPAFEE